MNRLLMLLGRVLLIGCKHEWVIVRKIDWEDTGWRGGSFWEYVLQCKKCGDMKSKIFKGR